MENCFLFHVVGFSRRLLGLVGSESWCSGDRGAGAAAVELVVGELGDRAEPAGGWERAGGTG